MRFIRDNGLIPKNLLCGGASGARLVIGSLLIVLFLYLIMSCQNPAGKSVKPDDIPTAVPIPENSYAITYHANGGEGAMKGSVFAAGVFIGNFSDKTFELF